MISKLLGWAQWEDAKITLNFVYIYAWKNIRKVYFKMTTKLFLRGYDGKHFFLLFICSF
jgi:hypothetical protein